MTICNPRLYDKKKVEGDGWKIQIQTLESLLSHFFHFSELGLTDELLAFLYWPVSMENELQLNIPTMLENHEKYAEKLKAFNLSRDARAQLAIK